jgi:polyphosphate glucokinase
MPCRIITYRVRNWLDIGAHDPDGATAASVKGTRLALIRAMATKPERKPSKILSIDIGGSKVKFLASGETEPRKAPSGRDFTPARMVEEVRRATKDWRYTAVSVGYPGVVGDNGPISEPGNLGSGWVGFDFAAAFECPVRIANDAAMQALGSYEGGRMLFLGFGTGLGSVLIVEHTIIPLELGELAYKADHTLSSRLGRQALEDIGKKKWRKRVLEIVPSLQRAFLADYVVMGGGNTKHIREPLPPNVRLGHNLTAFRGGYRLWGIDDVPTLKVNGEERPRPQTSGEWRLL